MGYSLSIAQAAEEDIREAFLWYEGQQEGLGGTFEAHILAAVNRIQQSPLNTQIRYEDTRVFFLKKFPYGIHFRVEGAHILIIAVFHTSRSPKRWEER